LPNFKSSEVGDTKSVADISYDEVSNNSFLDASADTQNEIFNRLQEQRAPPTMHDPFMQASGGYNKVQLNIQQR
jgi:hypothetical protein